MEEIEQVGGVEEILGGVRNKFEWEVEEGFQVQEDLRKLRNLVGSFYGRLGSFRKELGLKGVDG